MTTRHTTSKGLPRIGGHGSLTEQTTKALLEAIFDHQFPDNRVPPEPEIALQLGVSRTTVRGALSSLERLGVITRTPGRGTMIRPHVGRESIALLRLIGFRALLEERFDKVESTERYWLVDHASDRAVTELGVAEDTRMIVSEKRLSANGELAIHISDEIPLAHCSTEQQSTLLAAQDLPVYDSIFAFSRSWKVGEIEHTAIAMAPRVASASVTPLSLDPGTPFMRMLETHYTLAGTAIALSDVDVDDRFVRLSVVRHN